MQSEEGIDAELKETEAILKKQKKSKEDNKPAAKSATQAVVAQKVKSLKEDAAKPENYSDKAQKQKQSALT